MLSELDMSEKPDRIAYFLIGALGLGYSLNDAWHLLLHSKEGLGILNNEYTYVVHFMGIPSAQKADKENGGKYNKCIPDIDKIVEETFYLELLGEFIEFVNNYFHVPYDQIFNKMSIQDFYETCGHVLGNYDDKLYKRYLM